MGNSKNNPSDYTSFYHSDVRVDTKLILTTVLTVNVAKKFTDMGTMTK
jgi:hypothetical protein